MKKYLYFPIIILSMLFALTGCSEDRMTQKPSPVKPTIKGLTPLASADSWITEAKALQDKGFNPQIMAVLFSLENLPVECSTDDLTAAFTGDQCRYAVNVSTHEGKKIGYVAMYTIESDGNNPVSFNVRYYSQKEKGYFTSKPIVFVPNETLGTMSVPATLTWVLE